MNILITSAYKRMTQVKHIIDEQRGPDTNAKVFACDMNPAEISSIADFDGCFKVPICTSDDYVETILSLCVGNKIDIIITMADKEFIILSANKEMFGKYGVQVIHQGHRDDMTTVLGKKMDYAGETI